MRDSSRPGTATAKPRFEYLYSLDSYVAERHSGSARSTPELERAAAAGVAHTRSPSYANWQQSISKFRMTSATHE